MPFGILELLGIEPEKMRLVIQDPTSDKDTRNLIDRTSVINKETGKATPLMEFIQGNIEQRKGVLNTDVLLTMGEGPGANQFIYKGWFELAIRYELMEAISQLNPEGEYNPNVKVAEAFKKEFSERGEQMELGMKSKYFGVIATATSRDPTSSVFEELTHQNFEKATDRGEHLEQYMLRLKKLIEDPNIASFKKEAMKKVMTNELLKVLKHDPPIELEIEIEGKTYKNAQAIFALFRQYDADLSLTQLSEILNHVKKQEGKIGEEGVELLARQLDKSSEKFKKLEEAAQLPEMTPQQTQSKERQFKGFAKDFNVAIKMGLMDHIKKDYSKLEKYFRKAYHFFARCREAYLRTKGKRATSLEVVNTLGKNLNALSGLFEPQSRLDAATTQKPSIEKPGSVSGPQAATADPVNHPPTQRVSEPVPTTAEPIQAKPAQAQDKVKPPQPEGPRPALVPPLGPHVKELVGKFQTLTAPSKDLQPKIPAPLPSKEGPKVQGLINAFEGLAQKNKPANPTIDKKPAGPPKGQNDGDENHSRRGP